MEHFPLKNDFQRILFLARQSAKLLISGEGVLAQRMFDKEI